MTHQALLPAPRRRRFTGLTERQEKVFSWFAIILTSIILSGWVISIIDIYAEQAPSTPAGSSAPPPVSRYVTSALLDNRSPTTAYINDAALSFLNPLRGESGELRAAFRLPGSDLVSEPGPADVLYGEGATAPPEEPGIYALAVGIDQARRAIDDLQLVTLVPFSEKRQGKIGLYYLGNWPYEKGGPPRSKAYANPIGFIKVTRENKDTHVSEHFRIQDFLTKDQPNVWPKYLLLEPKLLDKLELVIQELESQGIDVRHVTVMSGFRTPRYNHSGGNTAGRANLSRHMYGDAADVFVDNDRNGMMDDINKDGRVNVRDAEMLAAAVDRVHRKHPSLAGGVGIYPACCGHGPFTHIDVRGYNARWRGTGTG